MAHGFSSVQKTPEPGFNLGAMVAGKIKDSFGMAAEERKARDEEIAKLEAKNKEDRTDEESQRLEELVEQINYKQYQLEVEEQINSKQIED